MRLLAFMAALIAVTASVAWARPMKVELEQTPEGWRLLRGDEPFDIKGVGGDGDKQLLADVGGNSFRTWGVGDDTQAQLDEAHRLGLAVTLGIWLGHERHGFDYEDPAQVAAQFDKAREAVLKYKDHPALLMWGVGNEMEGYESGDDPAIWKAVNDIAAMIHELDPNHPTMTVVAEIGGQRVQSIHRLAPEIDVVGINSYAGAASIPQRYRAAGGTRPYVVTEYGPPGTWEVGRNDWGVVNEPTSTAKAESYLKTYHALAADEALCLGSYAFTWGAKQETTATWFGMLLPDGSRLAAVDALGEAWTGRPPANRVPRVEPLEVVTGDRVLPGAAVRVNLSASDPEGDPMETTWVLSAEPTEYSVGGDRAPSPPTFPGAIVTADAQGAELRMPDQPGKYRLFVFVRDDHGGAAVANVPLLVEGRAADEGPAGQATDLPLTVYGDGNAAGPYIPSGYMGDTAAIKMDEKSTIQPHAGGHCLRVLFENPAGWGGVAWQDPANDWGDKPGGYDLTGAKTLSFWARGDKGGERVKVGYGLIGPDKPFPDTARDEREVTLGKDWKRYTFDLAGKDLSRIKTGFFWVVAGQGAPVTFYLDDIRYEGP